MNLPVQSPLGIRVLDTAVPVEEEEIEVVLSYLTTSIAGPLVELGIGVLHVRKTRVLISFPILLTNVINLRR